MVKMQGLDLEEGAPLIKWIDNKFKRNRNVLIAITGQTGSGKSYMGLRLCELWYLYQFNEIFPVKTHCCFSISEIMKLLSSGELRKGELIILEEGGVLLNSLDFQNKVSKLFNFVLQSFRSMNVGLIINLPVLSMLNKSCRLLLHLHLITTYIDYLKNITRVKPFFHQLNQQTGKIYSKSPIIKYKGKSITIKRFRFSLPSKELINLYEPKKFKFVSGLTEDFAKTLDKLDKENLRKQGRANLTAIQQETHEMKLDGLSVKEIAKKRGISVRSTYETLEQIKKKGYEIK